MKLIASLAVLTIFQLDFVVVQGRVMNNIMALVGIINSVFALSNAINSNCDFTIKIRLGERYNIFSPNYPQSYERSSSCRWYIESDLYTQVVISCEDVDLPPSPNCNEDRISLSLTGDKNFGDANNFCGRGTLSQVSSGNKLAIGLFSTWYSNGGKFFCTITPIVSEESPIEPPNPYCDCGWTSEKRIVGGVETGQHEFPAMVAIYNNDIKDLACGASIISPRYVVTAAHCLYRQPIAKYQLLVGAHYIMTANDGSAVFYAITKFIPHQNYVQSSQQNDIGIIQTAIPIRFSMNVGPICLPFRYSNMNFNNYLVTALGWGTLEFSGPISNELRKVNLTVVDNYRCREEFAGDSNVDVQETQLCTFGKNKDSCQYDSGGPIQWYNRQTRRLELVGIISFGVACASDYPSVNTRVTSYLAWIVSTTKDTDYCII